MEDKIKDKEKFGDNILDIITLYHNRNILDILLREVSLCDSITNSKIAGDDEGESEESDANSYISLFDFIDDKNNIENKETRTDRRKSLDKKRKPVEKIDLNDWKK